MGTHRKKAATVPLLPPIVLLLLVSIAHPWPAAALDVGDEAPNFTLPSTTGERISLHQFRAKKLVLLEFYGADFSPV
jgi:hypothetical protein